MRAAIALVLALAAFAANAHVGPHPEAGISFDQRVGARVPLSLPFRDRRGARTTLGDALDGKPAVLVLGYARCKDLCSVTLPGTAQALDRAGLTAGRDYRAVFTSIDPREDATALQEAVERIPSTDRAGWSFLGGDDGSVRTLARTVGFHYRYEPERDAYAHPEGIVVLSPDGLVSRYFFGASFDPGALKRALADAGGGRRGGIAQQLLLLCYHFDPATGRYTPRVLLMMRVLIGLCAVGAATCAFRVVRGRRHRGSAA